MSRKDYLSLFLVSSLVVLGVAFLQSVPGYMDADYYYAGGVQLFRGKGFNEPFLWNYLDNPDGLPHPSHTYWMPLTSIVVALGMLLTGSEDFLSARIFFILVAALLPLWSARITYAFTFDRNKAMLAGWWAVFSGFYLIYIVNTDSFGLYMGLGSLFLFLAFVPRFDNRLLIIVGQFLGLGVVSGLMHLARADGLLWFAAAMFLVVWFNILRAKYSITVGCKKRFLVTWILFLCVTVGYLVVMVPWYLRNIQLYGKLLSPASSRVFWLTDYNQMFAYPAQEVLNISQWSSVLPIEHFQIRWRALITNLKTTLAVQGEIFLLPLILLGVWKLRRYTITQFASGMWLLTLFVMTIVFPLAGQRGGFLHSGAALQPFLWMAAAVGFEVVVRYGSRKRGWNSDMAMRVLGAGLILISIILSSFLLLQRVVGEDFSRPLWRRNWDRTAEIERELQRRGANLGDIVIVNNPAGYFLATGRQAITLPYGDEDTLLKLAIRYHAKYLIIDENTPEGLQHLYEYPQDRQGLDYLASVGDTRIYQIELKKGK